MRYPWICLLTLALTPGVEARQGDQDDGRTPEFVADQKADRLYHRYLDTMMESPSYHGHNLTFRISNDIFSGGDGKHPEFYLLAPLNVDWVEIKYLEKESIYASIYEYFLDHPDVTLDELNYWPPSVHKRITYAACPGLKAPVYAVEQYIRTSLVSSAPYRHSGLHYLVGYARDNYRVTFRVSHEKARPVAELLEIRDIAMRCSRTLPTVAEEKKAEELAREKEQEEYLKNFKGPLYYSPPSIVARHGSKTYESATGSGCWGIHLESLCDDVFANVTPSEPIVVRRGDRIAFEIPERGRLESMDFGIARVTANDIRKRQEDKEFAQLKFWEKEVRAREMSEAQRDSIAIDKPPGDYILIIHGQWADYGDATHGFYLKVR